MEHLNIDAIKEHVQNEHKRLSDEAVRLRTELASVDDMVGRLDAVLVELAGRTVNGKSNSKRQLVKPSASKAQVTDFVFVALSADQVLTIEELKKRVEKLVVESGHSLMGFALRLKEALKDARFVATPEGMRLASSRATGRSTSIGESLGSGRSETTAIARHTGKSQTPSRSAGSGPVEAAIES